jgi:hypothetical protein
MDLDLRTSCGTPVSLTCELPEQVRFDCFVPGHGTYECCIDPRAEEILVIEVRDPSTGAHIALEELERDECSAVLEQAGDVCAVFDFEHGVGHDDAKALGAIADMALHETELRAAWSRAPLAVTKYASRFVEAPEDPCYRQESKAHQCLDGFINVVLVDRAQDMAEAAAKRRQAQWEEEQLEKAAYSRWSAGVDQSIKRAKEEGL